MGGIQILLRMCWSRSSMGWKSAGRAVSRLFPDFDFLALLTLFAFLAFLSFLDDLIPLAALPVFFSPSAASGSKGQIGLETSNLPEPLTGPGIT